MWARAARASGDGGHIYVGPAILERRCSGEATVGSTVKGRRLVGPHVG